LGTTERFVSDRLVVVVVVVVKAIDAKKTLVNQPERRRDTDGLLTKYEAMMNSRSKANEQTNKRTNNSW